MLQPTLRWQLHSWWDTTQGTWSSRAGSASWPGWIAEVLSTLGTVLSCSDGFSISWQALQAFSSLLQSAMFESACACCMALIDMRMRLCAHSWLVESLMKEIAHAVDCSNSQQVRLKHERMLVSHTCQLASACMWRCVCFSPTVYCVYCTTGCTGSSTISFDACDERRQCMLMCR